MRSKTPLPSGITRKNMMSLIDIITISSPSQMRRLEASSDFARPADTTLPLLFRHFFLASKFYAPDSQMFHIAQQGNVHHNAAQRSEETKSLLPEQLSAGQIERICKMIYGNESSRSVGKKCAKMFAEFGMPNGEFVELPDEIAGASFETLISVDQVRNIFLYLRARRARHKIMKYITTKYPDLEYPVDVMHNLGAAAHGWSKAIIMIRELTKKQPNMEQEEDISQKYFLKNPIIPFVLRVPIIRTTFDGVFPRDDPLIPGRSIVVCDIKEAAIMSNDVRFLFGTGVDERQCPFKDLFLSSTDQALKLKHKATL